MRSHVAEGPAQGMDGRPAQWSDQGTFGDRQGWQEQFRTSPGRQGRDGAGGQRVIAGSRQAGEWWIHQEQAARLSGRTRTAELWPVALQDRGQLSNSRGWLDNTQLGGDKAGLAHIFVCFSRCERLGTEGLKCPEEAVHLGDMNPHEQVRVVGGIRLAVRGCPRHSAMDRSYGSDGALGIRHGAVRGERDVSAGALKSSPEVPAEAGMLDDCLQCYRM